MERRRWWGKGESEIGGNGSGRRRFRSYRRCGPLTFDDRRQPAPLAFEMESLNVQAQTLPLDLSSYGFTPPLLSLPVIHPALLSSIVDMQNSSTKYLSIDPGESGKFNQSESNNNESTQPQVSSSRSDSDSTVSPTAHRHNVIVKNHAKRKKGGVGGQVRVVVSCVNDTTTVFSF
ncbi:hypothetical protein NECAME_16998 [Necator americanus]|uniref:Uncharacterized protein n=1 Tax=Necator americanus TaxID=51031 RepID=W2TT39_NECAM|nr:hypothetical protein NECAME_16998 [Necator americanus]ETN84819.1 hypothetical protein NECAME_16998 [Necator americanus]